MMNQLHSDYSAYFHNLCSPEPLEQRTNLSFFCIFLAGVTEAEGQAQQNIHPEPNPTSAVSAVQLMDILGVGLVIIYVHLHLALLLDQIYKLLCI